MKINRNNYEAVLIDLLEGNLSEEMEKEAHAFLLANPDIQEEFDLLADATMEEPETAYDGKHDLKKIPFQQSSANSDFFQKACVAKIENQLTPEQEQVFDDEIKSNKEKAQEFALFKKTVLHSSDLLFNEKLLIKKGHVVHSVTPENFETYCVAKTEGWLDQFGIIELNKFFEKYPEKRETLRLFEKIKLQPDLSIQFPDKRKIKKHQLLTDKTKKYLSYASAAAAIVVFSLMFYNTGQPEKQQQLSSSISGFDEAPVVTEGRQLNTRPDIKLSKVQPEVETEQQQKPANKQLAYHNNPQPKNNTDVTRLAIGSIDPILPVKLDCEPCENMFSAKKELKNIEKKVIPELSTTENTVAIQETTQPATEKDELLWKIAKAGVTGINKISNSNIQLKKEEENGETKIAFNTKYFGFSGNVNKKSND